MYKIIWEYTAAKKTVKKFELEYGPNGTWSKLFKKSPSYKKTELLKCLDKSRHYYVIDVWKSKKDYEKFKLKYQNEYCQYDLAFMELKEKERIVGEFKDVCVKDI